MRDNRLPDIVKVAHLLLSQLRDIEVAVDMTVGNGHDTLFLAQHFPVVYGFDLQAAALAAARQRLGQYQVTLICADHYEVQRYISSADLFVFNLGWLPGSDKTIVTTAERTLPTLAKCRELLNPGGLLAIVCYNGDPLQQAESLAVYNWLRAQPELVTQQLRVLNKPTAPVFYLAALQKN